VGAAEGTVALVGAARVPGRSGPQPTGQVLVCAVFMFCSRLYAQEIVRGAHESWGEGEHARAPALGATVLRVSRGLPWRTPLISLCLTHSTRHTPAGARLVVSCQGTHVIPLTKSVGSRSVPVQVGGKSLKRAPLELSADFSRREDIRSAWACYAAPKPKLTAPCGARLSEHDFHAFMHLELGGTRGGGQRQAASTTADSLLMMGAYASRTASRCKKNDLQPLYLTLRPHRGLLCTESPM
jgi:hypothetical protein